MGGYLLEFRLAGTARRFVKDTALKIGEKFHVRGVTRKRVVPHVSVLGPFQTDDERRLKKVFDDICVSYNPMTFRFVGVGSFRRWFGKNKVLNVKIEPSEELEKLRGEFISKLSNFCNMGEYDKGRYQAHVTLAFKDIDKKFGEIKKYLEAIEVPPINHYVLRLTLVGAGSRIVREFDLFQRRPLTRREALNRENKKLTLQLMHARVDGNLIGASPDHPFEIRGDTKAFVISDTHFDHDNVIRYCNRPFDSVQRMNDTILRNWNQTVGNSDIVFFLGDLACGRDHMPIDFWLSRLNGRIFFMRGNHDLDPITKAMEIPSCFFVRYHKQDLMLTHDPLRPAGWKGWLAHGDKHNNSPNEFPSVSCNKKTLNVCVEMTGYKPLALDDILVTVSRC